MDLRSLESSFVTLNGQMPKLHRDSAHRATAGSNSQKSLTHTETGRESVATINTVEIYCIVGAKWSHFVLKKKLDQSQNFKLEVNKFRFIFLLRFLLFSERFISMYLQKKTLIFTLQSGSESLSFHVF